MGNNLQNCLSSTKQEKLQVEVTGPEDADSKIPLGLDFQKKPRKELGRASQIEEVEVIRNGRKVTGVINEDSIDDGKIEFENGDLYSGAIWEGCAHGKGRMQYKNGDVYHGRFLKNQREGEGVLQFASGNLYRGTFKNNVFDGEGIFKFKNGNLYKGRFGNRRDVQGRVEAWVWRVVLEPGRLLEVPVGKGSAGGRRRH